MTSMPPSRKLELPPPEEILLSELERILKEVQLLHPLLDLLLKPEDMGLRLADTLRSMAHDVAEISTRQVQHMARSKRIEEKLDRILQGRFGPEEF